MTHNPKMLLVSHKSQMKNPSFLKKGGIRNLNRATKIIKENRHT